MPKPGSTKQVEPWTPGAERFGDVFVRLMGRVNTWVFRASKGRVGNKFSYGAPVCLLTTRGAKSGQIRTTPLIYLADEERVVIVASKGGMSKSPSWFYNLEAHPEDVEVQIGAEVRKMAARRASDEEKEALWPRLVEIYPDYEDYQARTDRNIPVMILSPR